MPNLWMHHRAKNVGEDSLTNEHAADALTSEVVSRVVGVGASAGGLEALQEFLRPLTSDGSTFIVAQHLSPDHPSQIVDLLSRATVLDVAEVRDGDRLRSGVVAVVPPNHDVTVDGDVLHLTAPPERISPAPSIDMLFESIAEHWGTAAVGVVLSGTGSDGARGLRAIGGAGGLTLVQAPESARFDGMPRAAIALGGVDLVSGAANLGERISDLASGGSRSLGELAIPETDVLSTAAAHLRRSMGIDFSLYKPSTLYRQIRRRMAIRYMDDIDDYLDVLAVDAEEARALSANLLVTVTSFFRDPAAFDALRFALQRYLNELGAGEVLRVWAPGCATGEEVYSIAMLVSDLLGHPADLGQRLKIFGTDLDEASLATARRATYPVAALDQIPEPLRALYVREKGDEFQIADLLRECAVFARHDVGSDAPFPRIDLISCRNTLIYFTAPLQHRVLNVFGFALRPGGLLFLGSAENFDRDETGFATVSAEHRIFQRTGRQLTSSEFVASPSSGLRSRRLEQQGGLTDFDGSPASSVVQVDGHLALLEELVRFSGNAYLVLDDRHTLIRVVGDVASYCQMPEGRMTTSVGSFLRPELRDEARALLLLCRTQHEPIIGQSCSLPNLDHPLHLEASRIQVGDEAFVVLAFVPDGGSPITAQTSLGRDPQFDRELKRLEAELLVSQEQLRRSLAELRAVNEELEASSEELQASSEELQASNEELQASNEELQAINEELGTLNQESSLRGDALQKLNLDLENIQAAVNQGMIIVDEHLRVTRFTQLAVRVFAMVDADLGAPLLSVPTTLHVAGLEQALLSVVGGQPRQNINIGDASVSYLLQVLPYRAEAGERIGAIITLTDVTDMAALQSAAETALSELQDKSALLAQQAKYDSLTGLLNRNYFSGSLDNEIARAKRASGRLALAWIDMDHFKEVNDEYGHEWGDAMLRTISGRVRSVVHVPDLAGRLGGDEIGVIITGYENPAGLDADLDRLLDCFREPVGIDGREARVLCSIGVALYPDDAQTSTDMLRAADAAMYAVKRKAGDAVAFFAPSMNDEAATRRQMRSDIASAIANREFEMHYQPIVDTVTNEVWGVEALIRWRRNGDLVNAADFIPFCEESGQIRQLSTLTLKLLLEDLPTIRENSSDAFRVALNMSVTQLEDRHLLELLPASTDTNGLAGWVIEIVESVFLPDHERALQVLDSLVALGAETSVDDYGSGYSNVGLLEALSPTYIKLDRTFLSERHSNESRLQLIDSAVQMSHVIGAKVIAEGVEDEEHRALLREAGADFMQGYGIARPLPLADLMTWLLGRPTGT
jgi:two-component system CheB/CheR fusion protein